MDALEDAARLDEAVVGIDVDLRRVRHQRHVALLRLEYRYADFGQANPTFFAYNLGANGDDRVFSHVWVKTHTVSLGAAYKF